MPDFGSLWPNRRRSRPPTADDLVADAIHRNPPTERDAEDTDYAALFRRLADQAVRAYRGGTSVEVALDDAERALVTAELMPIIAGLRRYLQHALGLSSEPHIECDLRGSRLGRPIRLRVTR